MFSPSFLSGSKGQASFEVLFIVSLVVLLATIVFVSGLRNFNEVTALGFVHNTYNEYKIKENYSGEIVKIDTNLSDGISFTIVTTKPLTGFVPNYEDIIVKNIKNNTSYNKVAFTYSNP